MEPSCACRPVLILHTIKQCSYINWQASQSKVKTNNITLRLLSRIACLDPLDWVLHTTFYFLHCIGHWRTQLQELPTRHALCCSSLCTNLKKMNLFQLDELENISWKRGLWENSTFCKILVSICWLWREKTWLYHQRTINFVKLQCKCIVEKEPGQVLPLLFIHHTGRVCIIR